MKSKILKELTPKQIEKMRKERIKEIEKMTPEYQLGLYVGEELVRRYLPTLDIDMVQTRNLIKVLPEEKEEHERLNGIWYKSYNTEGVDSSGPWNELRENRKKLEDKYLPQELICRIDPINVTDEKEFKNGIANSLWHSDLCHYKCSSFDDIEFWLDEDAYFTVIKLEKG